ncbi:MAG TPA: hypothetical protein PK095_17725 [Myxococcota bacterium]|nr:hypothetical protein [Myxococcota bacterium]
MRSPKPTWSPLLLVLVGSLLSCSDESSSPDTDARPDSSTPEVREDTRPGEVEEVSEVTEVSDAQDGDPGDDALDAVTPDSDGDIGPDAESDAQVDGEPGLEWTPLFDERTPLAPVTSFVREDGVIVTRVGDRGRDRHAKDNGPNDHYDHYLAHYWEYRTARIQLEDHVRNGESRVAATFITEEKLGAREFRVWFWGLTTTGQFHFNPQKEEEKVSPLETGVVYVGQGTWNDDFEKVSELGRQHKYTLDIVNKWENGGQVQRPLAVGMNMEFEVSQFLLAPPAGTRLNYYGTSFVYVIGQPGLAPFEWDRGVNHPGGANDGHPIPAAGLSGGATTLGYNYSAEPAGRFMQMATNLAPGNASPSCGVAASTTRASSTDAMTNGTRTRSGPSRSEKPATTTSTPHVPIAMCEMGGRS